MIQILDPDLKEKYLERHLPYRINSMLAHDLMLMRKNEDQYKKIKVPCYEDSLVVEPIFEISLIFGRSLLNFLGITLDNKNNCLKEFIPKSNDLTLKSIFPDREYCSIHDDLVVKNHNALCMIIRLANKSVAHLTSEIDETPEESQHIAASARLVIYKLMLKHVPEIHKDKIWWTSQGPKG